MIQLSDYLNFPTKLQHIDGRKVIDIYVLKKRYMNDYYMVQFEDGVVLTYPDIPTNIVLPQSWQGINLSSHGSIVGVQLGIIHTSFENATQAIYNAAFNLNTGEIRKR